jgi:octaprenyl-diphosphate synthase
MGKNVGDDLAEGKPTLPLIYVLENGSDSDKNLIKEALTAETVSQEMSKTVIEIVRSSEALAYTRNKAQKEIDSALLCIEQLSDSKYKDSMRDLAQFAMSRDN